MSAHTIENERRAKIKVQESKSHHCTPCSGRTILEKRKQTWQSVRERGVILCAHVCLCRGRSELNIRWRFSGVIHGLWLAEQSGLVSQKAPDRDQGASTSNPQC